MTLPTGKAREERVKALRSNPFFFFENGVELAAVYEALSEAEAKIAAQDKLLADWEERAAVGEFEDVRKQRDEALEWAKEAAGELCGAQYDLEKHGPDPDSRYGQRIQSIIALLSRMPKEPE